MEEDGLVSSNNVSIKDEAIDCSFRHSEIEYLYQTHQYKTHDSKEDEERKVAV